VASTLFSLKAKNKLEQAGHFPGRFHVARVALVVFNGSQHLPAVPREETITVRLKARFV